MNEEGSLLVPVGAADGGLTVGMSNGYFPSWLLYCLWGIPPEGWKKEKRKKEKRKKEKRREEKRREEKRREEERAEGGNGVLEDSEVNVNWQYNTTEYNWIKYEKTKYNTIR